LFLRSGNTHHLDDGVPFGAFFTHIGSFLTHYALFHVKEHSLDVDFSLQKGFGEHLLSVFILFHGRKN